MKNIEFLQFAQSSFVAHHEIDGWVVALAPGKQVWFSKGNLQYQATTRTWRFAEHQYDYVGKDNEKISETYDGWIVTEFGGFSSEGHRGDGLSVRLVRDVE